MALSRRCLSSPLWKLWQEFCRRDYLLSVPLCPNIRHTPLVSALLFPQSRHAAKRAALEEEDEKRGGRVGPGIHQRLLPTLQLPFQLVCWVSVVRSALLGALLSPACPIIVVRRVSALSPRW